MELLEGNCAPYFLAQQDHACLAPTQAYSGHVSKAHVLGCWLASVGGQPSYARELAQQYVEPAGIMHKYTCQSVWRLNSTYDTDSMAMHALHEIKVR